MSEDATTKPAKTISSHIREAEERRRERVRMANAADLAISEQHRRQQQPRKQAKERAEEAAIVAIESLGVHDTLEGFDSVRTARENIHKSVVNAFTAMARALDSEQMSSPQGIAQLANIGREALSQHTSTLNNLRTNLQRTRGEVEERLKTALAPPAHLSRVVEQARDAMRGMSVQDREALIANAKGEDSIILLYAVASAPAFLSGVSEGQRIRQRDVLIALKDPQLAKLEANLPKAFAAVDKIERGIDRLVNSVVDFEAAKALSDLRKA